MTATENRPDTAVRQNPARDTWNVLTRELKPVVRDPFTLIFSLVQPLVFLGLFAPLLIGTSGEPPGETLQWFVPGVLVMIVLFGTGCDGLQPAVRDDDRLPRAHARRAAGAVVAARRPRAQGDRADHRAVAHHRADRLAVRLLDQPRRAS